MWTGAGYSSLTCDRGGGAVYGHAVRAQELPQERQSMDLLAL